MPEAGPGGSDPFPAWVAALEDRHRRSLTFAEIRKGLQALSSLYVERRGRLASGTALEGAGKRAAFALYYGPAHFLAVRGIVRALGLAAGSPRLRTIVDLGCGTGAAGAAWALETSSAVEGLDRSGWAVEETRWTLARLRLRGSARKGDLASPELPPGPAGVVAAFSVNEIDEPGRARLLAALLEAPDRATAVLVVEPLARRALAWWDGWSEAWKAAGGREDEWRLDVELPATLAELGRAAGLDPGRLGARSLYLPARSGASGKRAPSRA